MFSGVKLFLLHLLAEIMTLSWLCRETAVFICYDFLGDFAVVGCYFILFYLFIFFVVVTSSRGW